MTFATERPEWVAAMTNAAIAEYDRRSMKARRAGYLAARVEIPAATAVLRAELERLAS